MATPNASTTDPRIAAYQFALKTLQPNSGTGTNSEISRLRLIVLAPGSRDYETLTSLPKIDRPMLRITPTFDAMTAYCQNGRGGVSFLAPLSLKLELRVPSLNWESAAAIWTAIGEAFNPSRMQPAERREFNRALRANGISEVEFTPAVPVGPDQVATGRLGFTCYT